MPTPPATTSSDTATKTAPVAQAAVFEKVLGAFETGGFTYADVLEQLKRLLESGASPTELLEILRRRELFEPLPDYAHVEVLGLLNDAIARGAAAPDVAPTSVAFAPARIPAPAALTSGHAASLTESLCSAEERIARQNADYQALTRSYERTQEAGSAATARATALAADLAAVRNTLKSAQSRALETDDALAEHIAAAEAARARSQEILRELELHKNEARTLRDSLVARDAAMAQTQRSLGERASQFAALQEEHSRVVPALEARVKGFTQLQVDLQAARERAETLGTDLAAARVRAETLGTDLAARDATAAQMRRSLDERNAQLSTLQQEHAAMVPALDARAKACKQLEVELQAARTRADEMARELKASQDAAAALGSQLKSAESHLHVARTELSASKAQSSSYLEALRTHEWRRELDQNTFRETQARTDAADPALKALQTERDQLQAQVASLQTKFRKHETLLEDARRTAGASADRVAALQAAAQLRESEPTTKIAQLHAQQATRMAQLAAMLDAQPRTEAEAEVEVEVEVEAESTRAVREREPSAPTHESIAVGSSNNASSSSAGSRGSATVSEFEVKVAAPKQALAPKAGSMRRALALSICALAFVVAAWFFTHRAPVASEAQAIAAAPIPKPGTTMKDCPTCPGLTVLPAGRFKQGSADADTGSSFEKPLHGVIIGRSFALSTNAVTVDEFGEFVTATGRDMHGCDTYDGKWKHESKNSWTDPGFVQAGTHPVACVSWNDADAYAGWLSAKTGHTYRLPSAAEWEYAARAGSEASQPWSSDGADACASANVADQSAAHRYPGWTIFACNDSFVYTAPVGSFKANLYGLNDMLGNVFQWTKDCWHADYAGAPVDGSARMDGDCAEHELRGGSWFSSPAYVRANYRNHFAADYRTSSVGIRLVRDIGQ